MLSVEKAEKKNKSCRYLSILVSTKTAKSIFLSCEIHTKQRTAEQKLYHFCELTKSIDRSEA